MSVLYPTSSLPRFQSVDIPTTSDVDAPISTSPPSPSSHPPLHSHPSPHPMTKTLPPPSFPPPLPRHHSTSSTSSPAFPSHPSTPHRKSSSSSLPGLAPSLDKASQPSLDSSPQWPPPPLPTSSPHSTQSLPPLPRPVLSSGPQSTPTISRRLSQPGLTYRGGTPGATPPSPPLVPGRREARELPLAPHPSLSLQHRHQHLQKFLSSPLGTALLLNKLRSGAIFLKHGQRGSPHYRFVWASDDLQYLHYSELKSKGRISSSVEVRSLTRVDEGHCSPTFARSRLSEPLHCFSVVGEGRTLDLECLSSEDREMWVIAFSFLIEFTRKGATVRGQPIDLSSVPTSLSLVSALELLCEQNHTLAQARLSSSSAPQRAEEERKEAASFSTPDAKADASDASASVCASHPQGSPSALPRLSPTSTVRVSHVNRFEVIDFIDEAVAPPPSHHVATNLTLNTAALSLPSSAYDDPRLMRLVRDLEQYKEDNKRLLVSHAHKMMRLQKEIDGLQEMNRKLRTIKHKHDRAKRSPGRECAGSDGELADDSDASDEH